MINFVSGIGRKTLDLFAEFGRAGLLLSGAIVGRFSFSALPLLIKQMYMIGVLSLVIITVSGGFIGMVLALQGYIILVDYGAEASLGPLVALSLLRELGPVVTGLLFAGRAGSALTAEIGLMKATEQLSSLEMMAIDPIRRIVAPRFWAGVICMPMLAMIFSTVGILGGYLIGVEWLGIDVGNFWAIMQSKVEFQEDIVKGTIKAFAFAIIVTWIALFKGYDAVPTSEGISVATTQTVVQSSLAVLGVDFVLTVLMYGE